MADPGAPTLIELGYVLGYITEAQFRAMPEFSTYVNRAGVPDTKADIITRANAAYPRAVLEVLIQVNKVFSGDIIVPGIAGVAGKSWRDGDDGSAIIESLDISDYGIQAPSQMWHLNGTQSAYLGGNNLLAKYVSSGLDRDIYAIMNARGGVSGEERFVYGARGVYDLKRYSASSVAGIGATMAFAAFIHVSEWNQSPDGIVIASHRAYDRADETGASYRLGFEIGLGLDSVTDTRDELALYYRHYSGTDIEVVRLPITGGGGNIALSMGREVFIAFTRTGSELKLYVNGLLLSTASFGAGDEPSPGSAPEMRLVLGSDWDGSRYLHGSMRNVAMWTGVQPTAANLLNYYKIGAGFLPKAIPA
jgi:hypothetical protein